MSLPEEKIEQRWVFENILNSVHINNALGQVLVPPYRKAPIRRAELVLPTASDVGVNSVNSDVEDQILSILVSKSVYRGKKSLVEPFIPIIRDQIKMFVRHSQPISFVLPSLPFKDQSPFTTGAPIDHVDLGEYALFAQLKRILKTIEKVYTPGAHITLLCDGYVYADIFADGDKKGAGRYKAACEKIKNEMGLYNNVTLFDMREVLFDMPNWNTVHTQISQVVRTLYATDEQIKERLEMLCRQFVFHVKLPDVSYEGAREIYASTTWPDWVKSMLIKAVFEYVALTLTLKHTDLVKRAFPSAVRCTVHPKAAPQIPLHLTNSHNTILPYNGVAVISRKKLNKEQSVFNSIRIKRLCDVFAYSNITAVYDKNGSKIAPMYYEID